MAKARSGGLSSFWGFPKLTIRGHQKTEIVARFDICRAVMTDSLSAYPWQRVFSYVSVPALAN
jgi:hypothetical protein